MPKAAAVGKCMCQSIMTKKCCWEHHTHTYKFMASVSSCPCCVILLVAQDLGTNPFYQVGKIAGHFTRTLSCPDSCTFEGEEAGKAKLPVHFRPGTRKSAMLPFTVTCTPHCTT